MLLLSLRAHRQLHELSRCPFPDDRTCWLLSACRRPRTVTGYRLPVTGSQLPVTNYRRPVP